MKTKHRVRVVAASVAGPLHCHKKLPCQDYFKFRREGKNFVAVVSDGAGSARYGKVGARVICETLIDHLKNTRPHQIIERTCQAVEAARRKLSLHRLNKGKKAENLNDFAATIVGVVYNEGQGCFFFCSVTYTGFLKAIFLRIASQQAETKPAPVRPCVRF